MKRTPPRELIDRARAPQTPEQLADQFAARAVEDILTPTPDGLEVFEELAPKLWAHPAPARPVAPVSEVMELRQNISELKGQIAQQEKRVEMLSIEFQRQELRDQAKALLSEMILRASLLEQEAEAMERELADSETKTGKSSATGS